MMAHHTPSKLNRTRTECDGYVVARPDPVLDIVGLNAQTAPVRSLSELRDPSLRILSG